MTINLRALLLVTLLIPSIALAAHGPANNISSIDGGGNGNYDGTLVHAPGAGADHPWYTFCAISGATVSLQLETVGGYAALLYVFDVLDNNAEVGDANTVDYEYADNSNSSADINFNFVAPSSGQFIIQVDSWGGGDGDYNLDISGASASPCASNGLEAKSIPTLSRWSIIAMLTLMLAFGAVTLRRHS